MKPAVGPFCCDKFEETPNNKVSDLSKLSKPYFKECKNKIGSNILKVKKEKYFKENLKVFMLKIVGKKCTIFGSGKPLL